MKPSRIRLLVVDDEIGLGAGVQEALRREGYRVDGAQEAKEALELMEGHLFNLVVTDVKMPGIDGFEFMQEARRRHPDTLFILFTAYGTVDRAVAAMKAGAYDYLPKPIDLARLRAVVRKALEFQSVVAENQELRQRLRGQSESGFLHGNSEAVRKVIRLVNEVANSEVTVLVEGESGTGKELVARAIHHQSDRAEGPFICVNCAALPEPLVEAELFGHVRGAFTGAIRQKAGRFQMADGGTLFLDEIGDLCSKGQGDLLRVLEDGWFRMVGGTQAVRVNVRVVAATNHRLQDLVEAGGFREDLYYRLQVIPVQLPPLRERTEDIPLLVEEFLDHFCAKHRRRQRRLTDEAMQRVQGFDWPGNVRQLRNALERIVLTAHGPVVKARDLPDFLQTQETSNRPDLLRPGMRLAEAERLLIEQTLERVTSNRAEAARVLGISRRALQYKLKAYGLLKAEEEDSPLPDAAP